MRKPKTNVETVKNLMEFSKYGPLAQLFVMDALVKQAERVAESTPEDYPENSMVNPEAWIGVAKEILEKLSDYR